MSFKCYKNILHCRVKTAGFSNECSRAGDQVSKCSMPIVCNKYHFGIINYIDNLFLTNDRCTLKLRYFIVRFY